MAAGLYDLYIEQGATFTKIITWKDSAGDPIDLTGFVARMQIRQTISASAVLYSATTENGGITLGGAAGTITITFPAADTAAFSFVTGVYDLELASSALAGAEVTRLLEGGVVVSKEVTR